MANVDSIQFDLTQGGVVCGCLEIAILGARVEGLLGAPLLVDDRARSGRDDSTEPVQLLEGVEYRYEVKGAKTASFDVSELFSPDDPLRRIAGRLRTGQSTGRVELRVKLDGIECDPIAFEVRSTKLEYRDHYRWMLGDLARLGSELVLERFAASEQRLVAQAGADSATLYQRFALLSALLESDRIDAALRHILASPYVQFETLVEQRPLGRPVRPSAALARSLCGPGPRVDLGGACATRIQVLPRSLSVERTEETIDNVPNRFVRFALEEWQAFVEDIAVAADRERRRHEDSGQRPPGWIGRAIAETDRLTSRLEAYLRHPVFADVGPLLDFPGPNQVLQRREGYREVLEAHALYRSAGALQWSGGEDVFHAGQRNVATLYEYWVFVKLDEIVREFCDVKPELADLVALDQTGMSLQLQRGREHVLKGRVTRGGRSFRVELWFNRKFAAGAGGLSWSLPMRPDCSLRIVPESNVAPAMDELWLHFDAKYKFDVRTLESSADEPDAAWAKADDLMKMHTYRDAITRAAGAYVVFPGTADQLLHQHGETLPSLGAFPLRPTTGDRPEGADRVRAFIGRVFDQLADQCSRYERARFWTHRAFAEPQVSGRHPATSLLTKPPADTLVLLGFAKSEAHRHWIRDHGLYNLRADEHRRGSVGLSSQELSAEFVIVYSDDQQPELWRVAGGPVVLDRATLLSLAYPSPGGERYLCLPLEEVAQPDWLRNLRFNATRVPKGAPAVCAWSQILGQVSGPLGEGMT